MAWSLESAPVCHNEVISHLERAITAMVQSVIQRNALVHLLARYLQRLEITVVISASLPVLKQTAGPGKIR